MAADAPATADSVFEPGPIEQTSPRSAADDTADGSPRMDGSSGSATKTTTSQRRPSLRRPAHKRHVSGFSLSGGDAQSAADVGGLHDAPPASPHELPEPEAPGQLKRARSMGRDDLGAIASALAQESEAAPAENDDEENDDDDDDVNGLSAHLASRRVSISSAPGDADVAAAIAAAMHAAPSQDSDREGDVKMARSKQPFSMARIPTPPPPPPLLDTNAPSEAFNALAAAAAATNSNLSRSASSSSTTSESTSPLVQQHAATASAAAASRARKRGVRSSQRQMQDLYIQPQQQQQQRQPRENHANASAAMLRPFVPPMHVTELEGWTLEEDRALRAAADDKHAAASSSSAGSNGGGGYPHALSWATVSEAVGRSAAACATRYEQVTRPAMKKGTWTEAEDARLQRLVHELPRRSWSDVAALIPGRSAKQCRERWCYNLDPAIQKGAWTVAEDETLVRAQVDLGNKWAQIAHMLPGRTENAVKTRFKSIMRAKKREWSRHEDETVLRLHQQLGSRWDAIAEQLPGRTKNAVKTRYRLLHRGDEPEDVPEGAPNQILRHAGQGTVPELGFADVQQHEQTPPPPPPPPVSAPNRVSGEPWPALQHGTDAQGVAASGPARYFGGAVSSEATHGPSPSSPSSSAAARVAAAARRGLKSSGSSGSSNMADQHDELHQQLLYLQHQQQQSGGQTRRPSFGISGLGADGMLGFLGSTPSVNKQHSTGISSAGGGLTSAGGSHTRLSGLGALRSAGEVEESFMHEDGAPMQDDELVDFLDMWDNAGGHSQHAQQQQAWATTGSQVTGDR